MQYTCSMKKILLALIILGFQMSLAAQSCTPDSTITAPGTYPKHLPDGIAGTHYQQTVQFRIASDTQVTFSGSTVTAHIDSIKVLDVFGLPGGISYSCTPASCALPGGKTSCGLIYGDIDANASGTYPFTIPIRIYVHIGGTFPYQQPDTLYNISMNVNAAAGIDEMVQHELLVYPNPATSDLNVALTFHAGQAEIEVFDRQGKRLNLESHYENNIIHLNTSDLPAGIYMGQVQHGSETYRFRFVRN
ncbi:MAG: T9SS type A sorting domain-containing protein [Bacteroidetes bacterium]|nr:T9SS type A sorting domain-containing protein [Bacteroidota bacterium]